mgnify:CR=1 FL=1
MDQFFRYFYQDIGRVFRAFLEVIIAFFNFLNYLLNFPMRMEIIKSFEDDFTTVDWIALLIANILLIALIVAMFIMVGRLFKRIFRFRVSGKKYDELVKGGKK